MISKAYNKHVVHTFLNSNKNTNSIKTNYKQKLLVLQSNDNNAKLNVNSFFFLEPTSMNLLQRSTVSFESVSLRRSHS